MTYMSLSSNSIAYLKPLIKSETEEDFLQVADEDYVVETAFNEDLRITYLVNDTDRDLFKYIQNRHLIEEDLSREDLEYIGLNNLYKLITDYQLRMQEYEKGLYVLFLDGNFEASLILLDDLWDQTLRDYVSDGFAAAIPCRDVIAFCDIDNEIGIDELNSIINRVWESEETDHLLINKILYRKEKEWKYSR